MVVLRKFDQLGDILFLIPLGILPKAARNRVEEIPALELAVIALASVEPEACFFKHPDQLSNLLGHDNKLAQCDLSSKHKVLLSLYLTNTDKNNKCDLTVITLLAENTYY